MTYREALREAGRAYLERVLTEARGKVEVAAMLAGMNRTAFYRAAGKHGIKASQRPYKKRA